MVVVQFYASLPSITAASHPAKNAHLIDRLIVRLVRWFDPLSHVIECAGFSVFGC